MDELLVSIVVVSYNQGKYIRENLDSIKSQTYPNIELIVADDASSDNSIEVFDCWLEENNYSAKKNYHTKNTGLATVLNECIEMATGKYIKLIAADDYLHPESIERCVNRLEQLGNEYGMVFSDTYTINDDSKIIADIADYDKLGSIEPELFRQELIKGNCIPALTIMMKLSALKETGRYDSKFIVEDYYRWLKINEKYLIAYIPEKLAYYRQHINNISKLKADRIETEDVILKLIFDKKGIAKRIIRDYIMVRLINGYKIDAEVWNTYKKYDYRNKILVVCSCFNFPPFGYRVLNRIIKLVD